MVEYCIAAVEDMELLVSSRLEMLRVVNDLPETYVFHLPKRISLLKDSSHPSAQQC